MTTRDSKEFNNRRRSTPIWEYRLYFTLIFLVGLVPATVHCFLARVGMQKRDKAWNGIVKCAWGKARTYTPMVFSA